MRVLRLDSWDGRPGGAQEYVRAVSDELAARGHPQRVLQIVSDPPPVPRPDERRFLVPPAGAGRVAGDLRNDARFREFLDAEAREFHPDLIHLHHFEARFETIGRWIRDASVPVVFTAHDAELVCPISTLIQPGGVICDGGVRLRCLGTGCKVGWGGPYNLWQTRVFDRMVRDRVSAFICPSTLLTRYLDANQYRPAVHLAPFVRLTDDVRNGHAEPPAADRPPVVGFIGRLEAYKGVQDLLVAAALLRTTVPGFALDVAGDGPYRTSLERQAIELGLGESIRWRGDLRDAAKDEWFRSIRVLAVPSRAWENFGFVAVEGLAHARPVVATDFGGLPDIVQDRFSGRLVPVQDPARLAAALRELLADPARAAEMGRHGRDRTLREFTPEKHLEGLLSIYTRVLAGEPLRSGSEAREPPTPTDPPGIRGQ